MKNEFFVSLLSTPVITNINSNIYMPVQDITLFHYIFFYGILSLFNKMIIDTYCWKVYGSTLSKLIKDLLIKIKFCMYNNNSLIL